MLMGLGLMLANFLSASPHIVRPSAFICGSAILSAAAVKTSEYKQHNWRYLSVLYDK